MIELVYGHRAILPFAVTKPPKPTYSYDHYAQELRERIRAINQVAREHLKQEKERTKQHHDKGLRLEDFRAGDKVLLHDETVRRGRSKKLDALWTGPYLVLRKDSDVNYTIKKGRRSIRVHANRLKHFVAY